MGEIVLIETQSQSAQPFTSDQKAQMARLQTKIVGRMWSIKRKQSCSLERAVNAVNAYRQIDTKAFVEPINSYEDLRDAVKRYFPKKCKSKAPKENTTYEDYINSSKWSARRKSFFEFLNSIGLQSDRCERCGKTQKAIHVHHLHYENLFSEQNEDLQNLCTQCHKKEHSERPYYSFSSQQAFLNYVKSLPIDIAKGLYPRSIF